MNETVDQRRARLWSLLGFPGGPNPQGTTEIISQRKVDDLEVFELTISTHSSTIPAIHLAPPKQRETGKAIVYCHAHGNNYQIGKSEVLEGRPALLSPPPGRAMAASGHHVICADMPCFGSRRHPLGEDGAAKAALWQGRTLLGEMLFDLVAITEAVKHAPNIPSGTVMSFGISMGATLAYWLAALVPTIDAAAHICAFSNIAPLIATGAHDLHGPYMTVPGLLKTMDMGDVAALIAPRPQFIGAGATDPLTPNGAWKPAIDRVSAEYESIQASSLLMILREPQSGHCETPQIRERLLAFLNS